MKRISVIAVTAVIIVSMSVGYVCAEPASTAKFKDMKASDWYAEAVGRLYGLKIIDGLPGGQFGPKNEVTRAQFVKMLVQAMDYQKIDSVSFDDIYVPTSGKPHWSSVYIETALRNGVISKAEQGNYFYPDVPLKRSDMFMMMFRALKLEPSSGANPFADLTEADGNFTKLYEEYLSRGITEGGKRLFKPFGHTTRAEAAVVIARLLDYKEDPQKYVARMGMEERFANGTQTEEDIALKRELEIEKAKADPNYIMEPIIRVCNTLEAYEGYGEDAEWSFEHNAGYISLDNFEDYLKYSPDCQFKIVCMNKDKNLLNTKTLLTQPFISYDHRYETRTDIWQSVIDAFNYYDDIKACPIKFISRDEESIVKGKWVNVPEYVKKGNILNFKISFKRGNNMEEYDVKFTVN